MADVAAPSEQDPAGDLDFLGDFYLDVDSLGSLDLFAEYPSYVDPLPGAAVEMMPTQTMDEIERFLMMEEGVGVAEGEQHLAEDFFADVLFAGSDEGSIRSGVSNGDATTPEENAVEGDGDKEEEEEKSEGVMEPEGNAEVSVAESEKETNGGESEERGGEDEDFLSKKRRRQMRNRDSAMKSRERKKMYVRDLEIKSKYLDSECRRLQHALHCCAAENIALRQCLQKAKALGAPPAKQESAVLFVESLLLGSLFWLVSIMCLFLMPSCPQEVIENASAVASSRTQIVRTRGLKSERLDLGLGSDVIYMKRKCKALRTRMKAWLFSPGLVLG